MHEYKVGDKVLYLGLFWNEFNLVDEVVGIETDEYLDRVKYLIKDSETGEVVSQYGTNYRPATDEEVIAGHRLLSNNGQVISVCNVSNNPIEDTQSNLSIKQNKPSSLLEYLAKCEDQVKRWPKWKVESLIEIFIGKVGFFEKKERGFLDTKSRIIVMPYKNIFDLESVVDVFQHGRNLYIKENST